MAVESFLPATKPRITIEKEVKPKLSIEELTTIESPGRPTPATFLEDRKKPRRTGAKISKTSNKANINETKISEPKKEYVLIITEKPQAAQKIASALGTPRKYSEDSVSYFEVEKNGEKIIIASAVGHLFGLTYKKGQKGWPIFDLEWIPSFESKSAAFTKKYYNLLKKLTRKAKSFIIATDFDIEGEVIGWNVLRFICNQKTAKRMKFSTLTHDELEKAYESPLSELAWGNAYAGETRHILDWLYGINLSRALMSAIKTTGSFRVLSIGRVQGPALKIIVDREKEISSFKSEPYWQVFAEITKDKKKIELKHPEDIFDKKQLDKFNKIKSGNAETVKKEESISPPDPFDLTSLQREAYRLHKISPSEALRLAQQLYLDGIISYPRTSSQKIPDSIEPKKILKALSKHFKEVSLATRAKPVEGKKSDPAHPSIYPTGEPASLSGAQEKLYNLIVKRFISAFSPNAITANKRITLTAENDDKIKFTASGLKTLNPGWTQIYPATIEEIDLPDLQGKVRIDKIRFDEKETQPPKRYTPTSLITLLEKKNLGTKSTRSMIVDTLFDRGYLDGTSIKATPLGLKLIESLEKYSPIIIDENLTRDLEDEMEKIQEETDSSKLEGEEKKVIDKAKKLITEISKEFKEKEQQIGEYLSSGIKEVWKNQQEANTLMLCPTCKKGNLRIMYNRKSRRYFVSCSAYPECKQTYSLPPNALIKKTDNNKLCESDGFPKLLAIRKGKRPWEFCFNPDCEIEKKKREEWASKKNESENPEEKGK